MISRDFFIVALQKIKVLSFYYLLIYDLFIIFVNSIADNSAMDNANRLYLNGEYDLL